MKGSITLRLGVLFCWLYTGICFAQQPFGVHIIPSSMTAAPAIHSGAVGVRNGYWVFVGGRRDGVHTMQANTAFPAYNRNDSVYVVDPSNNSYSAASVRSLPAAMWGALSSANMQSVQKDNYLYMIGGYGWVDSIFNWKTWPSLIAIDLDCLIGAVNGQSSINGCFTQLIDTNMAVSGGEAELIDSTIYLVFGHRFDGMYNRINMGFSQRYTEAIRKFNVVHSAGNISIANYSEITDTANFHRRDYNLVPQIFPNGNPGMTAFGGVFRKEVNLPFYTPVDIDPVNYVHQSGFNQNLVQYTTASLPLYDSSANYMHSIFFGGISVYTLDTTSMTLIQDSLVPFVSTISKVTRDGAGNLLESKLPEEMPALLGTNAFFIPDGPMCAAYDQVMSLDRINGNQRVGYIIGGIHSDLPNVTDVDPVNMSRPNAQVYEVWIDKTVSSMEEIRLFNSINDVVLYPNPARHVVSLDFNLKQAENCSVALYKLNGKLVRNIINDQRLTGSQHLRIPLNGISSGAYFFHIRTGSSSKVIRFVVNAAE